MPRKTQLLLRTPRRTSINVELNRRPTEPRRILPADKKYQKVIASELEAERAGFEVRGIYEGIRRIGKQQDRIKTVEYITDELTAESNRSEYIKVDNVVNVFDGQ